MAKRLSALPSAFGQDDAAWMTAACNLLVCADDIAMANRAIDLVLDTESHRPAPATIRAIMDSLRALRSPATEPDGQWKGCSCLRGWVHVRQWRNGQPYDFAGKCRVCQPGGAVDPQRLWEGYQ